LSVLNEEDSCIDAEPPWLKMRLQDATVLVNFGVGKSSTLALAFIAALSALALAESQSKQIGTC
jgi:hypothetical protein